MTDRCRAAPARKTLFIAVVTAALALVFRTELWAQSGPNETVGERVLLDYRDASFRNTRPNYDRADRDDVVPEFIGRDLHGTFVFGLETEVAADLANELMILGDAKGTFSHPHRRQHAYLLAREEPLATVGPPREKIVQALAIFENGVMVDALPIQPNATYQRIVGTVDVMGDGVEALLLETAALHMDRTVLSVDLVSLEGGVRILERFQHVYEDTCRIPAGGGQVRAKVISERTSNGSGALVAHTYQAQCLVGRDPEREDFVPMIGDEETSRQ